MNFAPQDDMDRALVAAALVEPRAYGTVIARYEHTLKRYVRRLLGSQQHAVDDVLQEVFMKAYVNLNDYDSTRPFSPWIYRIAHNEAISFLRKTKSEPHIVSGEDAALMLERVADLDDPDQALLRSRNQGDIHKALASLEQKYRDVLVLRYLEEKSYDEISDILHLPPGTVATLINRGLKRLREPLKASWGLT
jgi:RNA polymerase sigma-70 factor, ECF subfamily